MATKESAKKSGKPDYVKIGLLIGGGFLLYKLLKKVGGVIDDPTGVEQANEEFQDEIVVEPAKLTYPMYQYSAWASSLEDALLVDLTEDEYAVDQIVYRMQTDDDWKQLVKSFGVRIDYTFGYIPQYTYTLPTAILKLMPERVQDYNNHFAGWGMTSRI
jgi:hypothetical protein